MPDLLTQTNTSLKYVTAGYLTPNADAYSPNTTTIEAWFAAGPALKEANGGTGVTSLASIAPTAAFGVTPASASNATFTLAGGGVFIVTGGAMRPAQSVEAATGTSGGYSFAGDTNTLFYRSGADAVAIRTGGVDALLVNATQEVTVQSAQATTLLEVDNTATDGDPILAFSLSGTQTFTMGVDDGDSDKFKIGTSAIGTNTRVTVDSSGNVGIGTTAPDAPLDVQGEVMISQTGAVAGNTPKLQFATSGGTADRAWIQGDVTVVGDLQLQTEGGQSLILQPTGGSVGVGTTSPAHTIDVVGTAGLSTGTAWTNTSDGRLKIELGPIDNALFILRKLRPIRYKRNALWAETYDATLIEEQRERMGFIAQDLEKTAPFFIREEDQHGYMTWNPDDFYGLAVAMMQGLDNRLTALETSK